MGFTIIGKGGGGAGGRGGGGGGGGCTGGGGGGGLQTDNKFKDFQTASIIDLPWLLI